MGDSEGGGRYIPPEALQGKPIRVNREQIREQKLHEGINKLIHGEISLEQYKKIAWETHIEAVGGKEPKTLFSKVKSLFRR